MAFIRFLMFIVPIFALVFFFLWTWKRNVWSNRGIIMVTLGVAAVASLLTALIVVLTTIIGA